jgi:hypothetical protein
MAMMTTDRVASPKGIGGAPEACPIHQIGVLAAVTRHFVKEDP